MTTRRPDRPRGGGTRLRPKDPGRHHAPRSGRFTGEDGNAMILMPLGVLVMLVLAAIAVDAALLHRTQAELENTAAALTNDVAAAVGTGSLFDEDADIRIDPGLVDRLASVHAAASAVPGTTCAVTFTNAVEPTAAATCDGDANLIFRGAVGLSDVVPLTATEESLLENG